jgi:predicted transcriptional regulator
MTYEEVIKRINQKINKAGMLKKDIAKEVQISPSSLNTILKGRSCYLYLFMDILDEVGLELMLNDEIPIKSHQDLVDSLSSIDCTRRELSDKTKISAGTISSFINGDNVQVAKAFIIMDAMGVEVRVV